MSQLSNKPAAGSQTEPKARLVPAPLWAVTLLGILVYALVVRSINSGAEFNANVYGGYDDFAKVDAEHSVHRPPIDPLIIEGKKAYNTYCAACHQATGVGAPGQFPPLAKSDWVNVEGPNRIVRIVLNGLGGPITVNGVEYNNNMLAWRDQLTDRQIAAILSYIRNDWGNKGSLVQPEEVKKIRDATKDKGEPWKASELLAIPVK
jgi:mono/diheme cytochrome c family protein